MTSSQTAAKLQETIENEVLKVYGIQREQIFTITHDNGSNMVASVAKLRDTLSSELAEKSYVREEMTAVEAVYQEMEVFRRMDLNATDEAMEDYDDNDEENVDQENPSLDDEFAAADTGEEELDDTIEMPDDLDELLPESTRCAAHTCQLAVWDALKKHERRINAIKKLVLQSRQTRYKETFLEHKAHLAPPSNVTRWNAVYLMLKALREQKPFYLMLENKFPEMGK